MFKDRIRDVIKEQRKERQKKKTEKEKMKRRRRKFGQAPLKHAKRGLESCFLAGLTVFFMVLVFSVSYISKGDVSLLIGAVGFLMLVMSAAGVCKAVQGFKERDKEYISCKIGIVLNGIFTFVFIVIFLRGLF